VHCRFLYTSAFIWITPLDGLSQPCVLSMTATPFRHQVSSDVRMLPDRKLLYELARPAPEAAHPYEGVSALEQAVGRPRVGPPRRVMLLAVVRRSQRDRNEQRAQLEVLHHMNQNLRTIQPVRLRLDGFRVAVRVNAATTHRVNGADLALCVDSARAPI
jgi:hypothetical protein